MQVQYRMNRLHWLFRFGIQVSCPDTAEAVPIRKKVDPIAIGRPFGLPVQRRSVRYRNPTLGRSPLTGVRCYKDLPPIFQPPLPLDVFRSVKGEPVPIA